MRYLISVFVLTEAGEVIYNNKSKIRGPVQIFGGMISAFNSLFSNFFDDTLTSFEGKQLRLQMTVKRKFRFVGVSQKDIDSQMAKKELQKVTKKFFIQFPDIHLQKTLYDISLFKSFEI